MLLRIREQAHGFIAWTIIGLLCLTFALWGVQYYLSSRHAVAQVAQVNGIAITQKTFQSVYYRARQRWLAEHAAHGALLTPAAVHALKKATLDRMIHARVLAQKAKQQGYRVPDHLLASVVQSMPAFQEQGRFSQQRLVRILERMRYSEDVFFGDLARDLLVGQIKLGLTNSSFLLPHERKVVVQWVHQLRDAQYVLVPWSHFARRKNGVTAEAIAAYYEAHTEAFQQPEQVSVSYIRLSLPQVRARLKSQGKDPKKALSVFSEQLDQLSDLSYTHPESLEPAAQALGLSVQATTLFPQVGAKKGLIAHPKIVRAAYSDSVLHTGNNSRPIALSDEDVVVLRLQEHHPKTRQPLTVVQAQIRARLLEEAAQAQVAALSHAWVQKLQQGMALQALARKQDLSVRKVLGLKRSNTQLPAALRTKIFALSDQPASAVDAVRLANGDYAVVRLLRVRSPASSSASTKKHEAAVQTKWRARLGLQEYTLYVQDVMRNAVVKR